MTEEKIFKTELTGTINSFIFILKFYKGKNVNFSLDSLLENYDDENPFISIEKMAAEFNILAVNCENVNLDELKKCKYPLIINISSIPDTKHYVVCFGFDIDHGFLLVDHLDTRYYVKEEVMHTLWSDQACWAFVF